jgi:AcrR family transcriptional regulator
MATSKPRRNAGVSRAAYHHGDLRNALVRACLGVVAESGATGLSLRAVARRAGVSHTASYRHFADKDALLAAVAAGGFELLGARVEAAARAAPSAPAALRDALQAYLRFGRDFPQHVQLMFGQDLSPGRPALQAVAQATFGALVGLVRAAFPTLTLPGAQSLALALWAQTLGLLLLVGPLRLEELAPGRDSLAVAQAALDALLDRLLRHPKSLIRRR